MKKEYCWIWLIWGPFSIYFDYFLPYMVWWHPVTSLFSFLSIWIDLCRINPIDSPIPTFSIHVNQTKPLDPNLLLNFLRYDMQHVWSTGSHTQKVYTHTGTSSSQCVHQTLCHLLMQRKYQSLKGHEEQLARPSLRMGQKYKRLQAAHTASTLYVHCMCTPV